MMLIPALALMCLFAVGGGQAEVAVTGPDNVEVHAGGEAILICRVEQPYKFCNFINPAGSILSLDPHLSHEEGRISLAGFEEVKNCGVKISNVTEADDGVWGCEVTVVIEGNPQVGRSQANVTVLKNTDPDIGVKLDQNEEDGRGQMEASTNATILNPDHSQMKNDTGDQVGDVEGRHSRQLVDLSNETKSNDLENEETTIVSSTTIASEVEINYTEENLDGALNRSQDSDHIQATSTAPLVVLEVNPSAETSGEKNPKEAVSKRKPFMEEALEESKREESTNLSEEQVVVVTIIAVVIVAIIVIAIVKIKKLLCFSETEGEGEDAEKSTLQMDSIEKTSKSSQKSQNSSYDEVKERINP